MAMSEKLKNTSEGDSAGVAALKPPDSHLKLKQEGNHKAAGHFARSLPADTKSRVDALMQALGFDGPVVTHAELVDFYITLGDTPQKAELQAKNFALLAGPSAAPEDRTYPRQIPENYLTYLCNAPASDSVAEVRAASAIVLHVNLMGKCLMLSILAVSTADCGVCRLVCCCLCDFSRVSACRQRDVSNFVCQSGIRAILVAISCVLYLDNSSVA